jgi:hypothetical protein
MPHFDGTITLGTVLMLLTWVGTLIVLAWKAREFFDSKTAELKAEMIETKEEIQADIFLTQERLARLETKVDTINSWWEKQIERRASWPG